MFPRSPGGGTCDAEITAKIPAGQRLVRARWSHRATECSAVIPPADRNDHPGSRMTLLCVPGRITTPHLVAGDESGDRLVPMRCDTKCAGVDPWCPPGLERRPHADQHVVAHYESGSRHHSRFPCLAPGAPRREPDVLVTNRGYEHDTCHARSHRRGIRMCIGRRIRDANKTVRWILKNPDLAPSVPDVWPPVSSAGDDSSTERVRACR